MEKINLAEWNIMPLIVAFPILLVSLSSIHIFIRPTRDILLENDEQIKKQLKATNDFVHEYLPKILEEVRKR
jgi:regulatory protein YycI of two-component signal transduction system YycFG